MSAAQTIIEFSQRLKQLWETGSYESLRCAANTAPMQAEIIRRMTEALEEIEEASCASCDGFALKILQECAQLITEAEAGK